MKNTLFGKKWVLVAFLVMCLFQITSCGRADEEQILRDVKSYEGILSEKENIKEFKITNREENKKEKIETIDCIMNTEDAKCSYEKEIVLTYCFNDENGWVLDSAEVNAPSEWNINPLVGVDKEEIMESIEKISITIEDEIWQIHKENVSNISIEEQATDLVEKTDVVTVMLTMDDKVKTATGNLQLEYVFDADSTEDTYWCLESYSGEETFVTAAKAGMELDVTEQMLIENIDRKSFTYGTIDMKINQSEISDFEITSQKESQKGTEKMYECKFVLAKEHADFEVKVQIPYSYINEWRMGDITVDAKCNSVAIEGTWVGQNVYGRTCELIISDMDDSGNISGVYTEKGDNWHAAYSYNVSGTMDFNNMSMYLQAGDLIGAAPYKGFKASDITASFFVDEQMLSGRADLQFNLYLEE
ncbi:MAG: hypothetical protein II994_03525 [Lachnospiraceae bacterium]|nr:hypothetical protein [Lachnospiraceae bacterium]